jgi:hypothetical protein
LSYCRWSSDDFKSNIYAYDSGEEGYIIIIDNGDTIVSFTAEDFLDSLYNLRVQGFHVPQKAIDRVVEEIKGGLN